MIVLSKSLALSQSVASDIDPDLPAVGWHNLVTPVTILASAELANYPVANLANPATHLEWRGSSTAEHRLFVTTGYVDEIDYVAFARHNFGSAQIAVSIETLTDGGGYVEILEQQVLVDDGPVILRFAPQPVEQTRIRLFSGTAAPRAAVLYAGKLLDMERKIYVGTHAASAWAANERCERDERVREFPWSNCLGPVARDDRSAFADLAGMVPGEA